MKAPAEVHAYLRQVMGKLVDFQMRPGIGNSDEYLSNDFWGALERVVKSVEEAVSQAASDFVQYREESENG